MTENKPVTAAPESKEDRDQMNNANIQKNVDTASIFNHIEQLQDKLNTEKKRFGLLRVRTANERINEAKSLPNPTFIFDNFVCEGELTIIFADTNVGKSILALQIADSITTGKPIQDFKMTAQPQKVAYFDMEMSDKQFEKRASDNFTNHYQFSDLLDIITIDYTESDTDDVEKLSDSISESVEQYISATKCKFIVFDNITYLSDSTEKANEALPLMKRLKRLKDKYGLTMLVLAHTPKRDQSRPITTNDLQGSKMIANFADAIFAIGLDNASNKRYLKQLKVRLGEKQFAGNPVAQCHIEYNEGLTRFIFDGATSENDFLTQRNQGVDIGEIRDLRKQGLSIRAIAARTGHNKSKVERVLKTMDFSIDDDEDTTQLSQCITASLSQGETRRDTGEAPQQDEESINDDLFVFPY